jgi:hypothetical protein
MTKLESLLRELVSLLCRCAGNGVILKDSRGDNKYIIENLC